MHTVPCRIASPAGKLPWINQDALCTVHINITHLTHFQLLSALCRTGSSEVAATISWLPFVFWTLGSQPTSNL